MSSAPLRRRFGSPLWDGVIRGTGVLALLAIPAALWVPDAAVLAAFVLVTMWVHGPMSPLLPAAYEPTLLLFGRLYPPLLVALLGTLGELYVELLNYELFRAMRAFSPVRRLEKHPFFDRAVRLFERRPFFTVWLFAWSPLPFWMVRVLAPAARYPMDRYLLATALGRLPRFWFLAALGAVVRIPPLALVGVALGSAVLAVLAIAGRSLRRLPPGAARSRPPLVATEATTS